MTETKKQYIPGKSGNGSDFVVWDIETIGLPEDFQRTMMPTKWKLGNVKDPAKVAAATAEAEQEWLADAALKAERGRIAMIGTLSGDAGIDFLCDDEKTLLTSFWEWVRQLPEWQRIVGFNTSGFDVPFIVRRSMINGVKVPPWIFTGRGYVSDRFVDLMTLWQAGDRREMISLDRLAKAFRLPGKTGNGADFGNLWATDRAAAIEYNRQDLLTIKALAERMLA